MNTTNESTELLIPESLTRVTRVTVTRLKSTAQFEHRKIEMVIDIGPNDSAQRVVPLAIEAADIVLEDPPYDNQEEDNAHRLLTAHDQGEQLADFTIEHAREVQATMEGWRERRKNAVGLLDGICIPRD